MSVQVPTSIKIHTGLSTRTRNLISSNCTRLTCIHSSEHIKIAHTFFTNYSAHSNYPSELLLLISTLYGVIKGSSCYGIFLPNKSGLRIPYLRSASLKQRWFMWQGLSGYRPEIIFSIGIFAVHLKAKYLATNVCITCKKKSLNMYLWLALGTGESFIDCSVGWWVNRSVDWLGGWLIAWSVNRSVDLLGGSLSGQLVGQSIGRVVKYNKHSTCSS